MKIYLDTNIWIDYFDKKRVNHNRAIELFKIIKERNHLILVTELHIYETKVTGYYQFFEKLKSELWKQGFCKGIKIKLNQRIKAEKLNEELKLGIADCLHVIVASEENCLLVSNDKHWKKITKAIGKNSLSYEEVLERVRL